ncbi:MAG: hypothetical protein Kow0092_11390 [Deferrisomatales bacterium]
MKPLNRREFLAVGGLGTASLALENKARLLQTAPKPWNARTSRSLRKYRDPLPTACPGCDAHCPLVAYRDGDRVVQVLPNAQAPVQARACPRAFLSLEALYDPERLLRPLRRAGPRGSGRWEPISWAEAIDRLADALARDPGQAYVDLGRPDPLAGSLLPALGVTRIIEDGASRSWAAREAQRAVYGAPLGRPDVSGARTLLLVGAPLLDEGNRFAPTAADLVAARMRGAALLVVGPHQGATGSIAEEWIPTRPGTEGLVLLALARIALEQGWVDLEAFARAVGTPADQVARELAPYSPDRIQASAGISAPALVRLARRFAQEGPSLCLADSSGTKMARAVEAASAVLNCLQGDPEQAGVRLAHAPQWAPRLEPTLPRTRAIKDVLAGDERASVYLAYRSNPVYWSPRAESVRRAFAEPDRVGLVVAVDTHLTETAAVADLVLPAAADLELWNLFGGYTPDGKPFALLQQPAPRPAPEPQRLRDPSVPVEALFDPGEEGPLGEARQLGDILLDLARRTGGAAAERASEVAGAGAFVRRLVDTVPELRAAGGFHALAATGAWAGETAAYPWAADAGFSTSTGRVEVGLAFSYQVPDGLRRLDGGRFALVVLRYPELDPAFANTRWGREIRFANPVYMNASVARELGLAAGDAVTLRTAVGEATGHVAPVEGIHPQAVAVAEDFGHWAGGAAATARGDGAGEPPTPLLVKRKDFLSNPLGIGSQRTRPAEAPWWHEYGPGVAVSALSPFTSDAYGAQAWRELPVTVQPA